MSKPLPILDPKVQEAQIDRTEAEIKALEDKIKKLKAEQEALRAEAELGRQREEDLLKLKLKLKRDEMEALKAGKIPPAAPANKAYLEVTIGARNEKGAFSVREFGADGKAVGMITFENLEVLTRFLTRTGKDAAGPKEVRFTGQADVPIETLKTILDVCQAAGFKTPARVKIGTGRD